MSKERCLGDVGFASEACSLSQRPHMNFHDFHVISAHTGLASPVYIGALLFSDSLFSCPGRDSVIHRLTTATMGGEGGGITVQTLSSSASLQLFMSPKHWEAVICIYIRSLDQARGLLALGVLVCPSAVSSDSRHASSGNLCTSCVDPWSVSTSKLSCCLSLLHFLF